jgi:hypothetical protein
MTTNFISYSEAVKRFNNSLILCNNIAEIDPSIFDNIRFSLDDEDGNPRDIYQYYLTDCSRYDVEYLSEWFGLLFTYSDMLDCFVLCVDHFGTSWRGVMIEDRSPRN